ncbi:MAG: O-antigen ligase family protein [Proteobacteria bacterium]|nr:O-antigen ligase family protein [Pseudomonadota bacterium]
MKAQATSYAAPLITVAGRTLAITALAVAAITVFDLGGHSSTVPKWLAVHFCAALAALDLANSAVRSKSLHIDRVDLAALGLFAWAALSLLWSADPQFGAMSLLNFSAALMVFVWVRRQSDADREFLLPALFCGAAVVTLAFILTLPGRFGGFGNRNFVTEFLLTALAFPLSFALSKQMVVRLFGLILAGAILLYLLAFNDSKIEFFVVPLAALLAFAVFLYRRLGIVKFALVATVTLAIPAVVAVLFWRRMGFDISTMFRFELLTNTTLLWLESPIWGHGLGSFDFEYPRLQEEHLAIFPWLQTVMFADMMLTAGAAHNDVLHGLAELGLIGMGILGYGAFAIIRRILDHSDKTFVDYTAGMALVALLLCSQLEFPFQNAATAFAGTILVGHLLARRPRDSAWTVSLVGARRYLPPAAVVAILPGLLWMDRGIFIAQKYYLESWSLLLQSRADLSIGRLMMAYEVNPFDRQIREQLFLTLMAISEVQRQLPLSIPDMDEYYRISASAGPYWPALIIARLAMLLGTEELRQTRKAEIAALFAQARKSVAHQPNVHFLDASDAVRDRDWLRARDAIARGLALIQTNDRQRQAFLRLQQAIPAAAR